jgi:hypothetical protein
MRPDPVILIGLGIILLLNNLGVLDKSADNRVDLEVSQAIGNITIRNAGTK